MDKVFWKQNGVPVVNNLKLLRNLSKPRPGRQRERRQTRGLMSRTIAVHVRYKSLYISLPFSAKQQRKIKVGKRCNLARAQGFQKPNMPSIERSFYLLNSSTICVIFLYICMQCIDGFSILLQRYLRKGNGAENPASFRFCLLPKEPN